MRKLEVVHKEVGGYRTKCACIAASIALNDECRYRAVLAAKKDNTLVVVVADIHAYQF